MKNISGNQWWIIAVISAFLSVFSFFKIDSAFADDNNFNSGLVFIGILLALNTAFALYNASKK